MKKKSAKEPEKVNAAKDDLFAKLTVLSQTPGKPDACPDLENLAAFSEGRCKGKERDHIIAHLNECPDCRRIWMQVGSAMDETQAVKVGRIGHLFKKLKGIKPRYFFAGSGFGLALAASLLIFFAPRQDELHRMLATAYVDLPSTSVQQFNSFASRGEDQNPQTLHSEAMSIYAKGIAAGKARLLNPSEALAKLDGQNSGPALFFSLGQWTVLLRCACLSAAPVSLDFWAAQQSIALNLQDKLKHAAQDEFQPQPVMDAVAMLQEAVRQISETGATADGCEDITTAIDDLESRLR